MCPRTAAPDRAARACDRATPGRAPDRRSGGPRGPRPAGGGGSSSGPERERRVLPEFEWDKSIVRFTREKLLSLRPGGAGGGELPAKLKHMEGVSVITEAANDPGKTRRWLFCVAFIM